MTEDEIKVFSKLGISQDDFFENSFVKNNSHIYSDFEIDSIVAMAGVYQRDERELNISIGQILGYEQRGASNIFESLPLFFNSKGDGYHTRSIGMLDYSSDEIVNKLAKSFQIEPVRIKEMDNGKYVVSNNGLHRFTILKLHYIAEMSKIVGNAEKEVKLNEKYKIPCYVSKIDYTKTYCNFLLHYTEDHPYVSIDIDQDFRATGKARITKNGKDIAVSDEDLLKFTKNELKIAINDNSFIKQSIEFVLEKNEKFKDFVQENFDEIFIEKNTDGGREE